MKKTILLFAFFVPIFCFGQNGTPPHDTIQVIDLSDIDISVLKKEVSKDGIVTIPEKSPEFDGGQYVLMTFLAKEIKYPKKARRKNIQGRVVVRFVIEEDGRVSTPSVLKKVHHLLDEEYLRVVMIMPKWKPGMHHGKVCRSYFTLPISFKLD